MKTRQRKPSSMLTSNSRFVLTPSQEVMDRLAAETKDLENEKANLDKKLHYLETTLKNSKSSFESILKNAGGG